MSSTPTQKVTRDDIEQSLRAIQTGVDGQGREPADQDHPGRIGGRRGPSCS